MANELTEAFKKAMLEGLAAEKADPDAYDEARWEASRANACKEMPTVENPHNKKKDAPATSGDQAKRIIDQDKDAGGQ